jgi:hypothetical protein
MGISSLKEPRARIRKRGFFTKVPCHRVGNMVKCRKGGEMARPDQMSFIREDSMSTRTSPQASTTPSPQANQLPQEKVAMRAYQKWCQRGCPHGSHLEDWLQAEAELRAEMSKPGAHATSAAPKATAQPAPQRSAARR